MIKHFTATANIFRNPLYIDIVYKFNICEFILLPLMCITDTDFFEILGEVLHSALILVF